MGYAYLFVLVSSLANTIGCYDVVREFCCFSLWRLYSACSWILIGGCLLLGALCKII